jgi:hypothetical protein
MTLPSVALNRQEQVELYWGLLSIFAVIEDRDAVAVLD